MKEHSRHRGRILAAVDALAVAGIPATASAVHARVASLSYGHVAGLMAAMVISGDLSRSGRGSAVRYFRSEGPAPVPAERHAVEAYLATAAESDELALAIGVLATVGRQAPTDMTERQVIGLANDALARAGLRRRIGLPPLDLPSGRRGDSAAALCVER